MTETAACELAQAVQDYDPQALAIVSQDEGSEDFHRRATRTWMVAAMVGRDIMLLRHPGDWLAYLHKQTEV